MSISESIKICGHFTRQGIDNWKSSVTPCNMNFFLIHLFIIPWFCLLSKPFYIIIQEHFICMAVKKMVDEFSEEKKNHCFSHPSLKR